jgi:hypothetical protein
MLSSFFSKKIRVYTAIYFEVYNLNLGHAAFQLIHDLAGSMKLKIPERMNKT